MLLQSKNAVIYGGGGAIGGAVARAFAREGAKVGAGGRSYRLFVWGKAPCYETVTL